MRRLTNAEREFLEAIEIAGGVGLEARPGTYLYDNAAAGLGLEGLMIHRRIDDAYRLFLTDKGYARLRSELAAEDRRSSLVVVPAGRTALATTQGREAGGGVDG